MGAQPIRIDFEGSTHEFPPDFTQQDIQKALLRFHGAASGSQPGLVSIEGQPTGVRIQPTDDEQRLAAFKQLITSGKERSVTPEETKSHEANPLSFTSDVLHLFEPGIATPSALLSEGLAGKAAKIFQNLKSSGAFVDATGGVSPRTYHMLRFFSKLKDAFRDD